MAELRRHGFDFGRLSNEIASRDAELPPGELVACLRSEVMRHWAPPGGGGCRPRTWTGPMVLAQCCAARLKTWR
jgi:hypothetical protein